MLLKTTLFSALVAMALGSNAVAQNFDDIVDASLITGWRQADGSHMAGIRLKLKNGWHTYWRAPGDAGIPPTFDMVGSHNFKAAQIIWPRPEVYEQNGLRSIVYHDQVILPLQIMPKSKGGDITVNAKIDIGVCKEICVPQTLRISAVLPAADKKRDGRIVASLAERAYTGKEAGAKNVRCQITPTADGILLTTTLSLPTVGRREAMVIEAANSLLWIAEPQMRRSGNTLSATTDIQHVEGAPFMLNRSGIRITVLGENKAVEITGCTGG